MLFLRTLTVFVLFTLLLPSAGQAKVWNVKEAPGLAAGDGATDDRPALARALAAAEQGDTILIPGGDYRIVLTKGALSVPEGVMLLGEGGRSRLLLYTNGTNKEHREFLRLKSDVTLQGLGVVRNEEFPVVLLPLFGDLQNITLLNCQFSGNTSKFPGYCHAVQVGVGTLKNLTLGRLEVVNCSYGLFQANEATGTLDGVSVKHCLFSTNTASDLEFNSPRGTMRNIIVRECVFANNLCKTASAGFAVGFANVTNGYVENCQVRNYNSEVLHVEDRSTNIRLTGNTIVGGSRIHSNGIVMVLSSSKDVTVADNFIDARKNTNKVNLVLVTAGGKQFKNPSDVTVKGNVLINGPATRTWYLQGGSGPPPLDNIVVPAPAAVPESAPAPTSAVKEQDEAS